ncbi:MAG: hypothetical protein RLO08_04175 [Parvibaculaceae bacterium]
MNGRLLSAHDEALILVKALPHRSSNYFETVCCAGIGHDQKWRRQYPVPFRILDPDQQFSRWTWIEYDFTKPKHDKRAESQKVVPESIKIVGKMKREERASFLEPLIRQSTDEAAALGETLTLVRPREIELSWRKKAAAELRDENRKHENLVKQLSLLDKPARPLKSCPYEFSFSWKTRSGSKHRHICDDWETSTAFFRRRKSLGEIGALNSLKATYEEDYLTRGLSLALGTHQRRPKQWLLVGVIRLDENIQSELPF